MAAVQSRLPTPSLKGVEKGVEKGTTNPTITSKLRQPTPVSISSTAPSSPSSKQPTKQPQPTNQQKEKSPSETTPQVEVPNKKLDFTYAKSRIGSLDKTKHKPKGENVKGYAENPDLSNIRSRIGSPENVTHTLKGGDKRIVSAKPDFSKVKSRVGSLENAKHVPKGGNVKIYSSKPDLKHVHSRVGSLDNIEHVPKGGERIIFNDKLDFSNVKSRIGSLDNIDHVPKGGDIVIFDDKLNFSNVKSRIGSLNNIDHVPKGGDVRIFDEKLRFKEYASPKIVSRSSTNSSSCSSVIADDDVSSLVNSPISSFALDDPPEVDPSQKEDATLSPHTPTVEVLSPIMEHFEGEEEVHEDEGEFLLPVRTTETERSFEVHDSLQQQQQQRNDSEKKNKHTEFSSKKETDFVYKDRECSGKETRYQQHEIDYDSTSMRESTLFVTNNSLSDSDLSFEVNVQRKSTLLSGADRNSIGVINPASPENLVPTVEIPPKIGHELHKPELTIAQQRDYDESWI